MANKITDLGLKAGEQYEKQQNRANFFNNGVMGDTKSVKEYNAGLEERIKLLKKLKSEEEAYNNATLKGQREIRKVQVAAYQQELNEINAKKKAMEELGEANNEVYEELQAQAEQLTANINDANSDLDRLRGNSINRAKGKNASLEDKADGISAIMEKVTSTSKKKDEGEIDDKEYLKSIQDLTGNLSDIFGGGDFGEAVSGSLMNAMTGSGFTGMITDQISKIAGPLMSVVGTLNKIHDSMNQAVDEAMSIRKQYLGPINARLEGTDKSFDTIAENMENVLTGNPYVKQTEMLNKVSELTRQGIVYNLEDRALIATLQDKMVQTFEATNANLTRLIRLQQADTTKAALGSEALLNQLLGGYFQDTSYLNDGYDSVNQNLLEANSLMSRDMTSAFNYTIQKWLGALYSVGMSQQAVNTIAQGIGYIGSGNLSALSGNDTLQTLMAMSAQRAGLSYADMLGSNASVEDWNNFMKSMVEYLQSIAENTSNNVTKSAFANIIGLAVSDIRAASNLTATDIANVYGSNTTYSTSVQEYKNQLNKVQSTERTTLPEMVDNIMDNVLYTFGENVTGDTGSYLAWKSSDILDAISGIIPTDGIIGGVIKVALKTIGSTASLFSTVKALTGTLIDGFQSLFSGGLISGFDYSDFTERGSINQINLETIDGLTKTLSYSGETAKQVGTSAKDKLKSLMSGTSKIGEYDTISSVTNYESGNAVVRGVEDIYGQLFDNQTPIHVIVDSLSEMTKEGITSATNGTDINTKVKSIEEKLTTGEVKVDVGDSDMSALLSRIDSVRSM